MYASGYSSLVIAELWSPEDRFVETWHILKEVWSSKVWLLLVYGTIRYSHITSVDWCGLLDCNSVQFSLCYTAQSLNGTIHGREIQLFCYITNSQILENENASVTWSILLINSDDAIFSNILCCLPVDYLLSSFCNWFQDWFQTGLDRFYTILIVSL